MQPHLQFVCSASRLDNGFHLLGKGVSADIGLGTQNKQIRTSFLKFEDWA